MNSLKWLFVTPGISILLSAYSIYNLIDYLRLIEMERVAKIAALMELIADVNTRLNETIKICEKHKLLYLKQEPRKKPLLFCYKEIYPNQ